MDDPEKILDQVRDCLTAWSIEAADITVASLSENIVYRVDTADSRSYGLRIHRPGYHTLAELESEHEWTAALAAAGFSVPAALMSVHGDYYVPVTVNGRERYAGVIPWLDGETLYDWEKRDHTTAALCEHLTHLGELMAEMHNFTASWQPSEAFTRHRLDVDGFFGAAPHWGRYWESEVLTDDQRQVLDQSRPSIIERLQSLGYGRDVFGMIHADMHHANVFLHEEGMSIIDFDDAGFGWYLYDIAVALQSYLRHPEFDFLLDAIVAGYRRARPLSDLHAAEIPFFMHIRARATIGWATARPELDNRERIRKLAMYTCAEAVEYLP